MDAKYSKINQLSEGDKQSTIEVAIIRKGNAEDYNTSQGCGKLLKLILIDREGMQISVVMFNDVITKYQCILAKEKSYIILNAVVKSVNKNYPNVNNDIELTITSYTNIKEAESPLSLEKMLLKYQPLDKVMEIPEVDTFDVLGFVNDVKSCIKGRYVRRQITLMNDKMESMEVMFWGSLAEIEDQLLEDMKEKRPIVALSNVQGNTYQDMITPAQSIVDGETLVSLSQSFELGFFSPANSKNRFLGIWYKNSPGTVLWVANRNSPITDANGHLTISGDGNLILLDGSNSTIWSSIVTRKAEAPVAQLLDSGNFVLKENLSMESDAYLWQSFDYPTDNILPGMRLGKNFKTGFEWTLSSWKSASDPSSGNFTYRLDIHGLPYLVISSGLAKRFRTGPWNGLYFGGVPSAPISVFKPILVNNQDEIYYMYESLNNPIITRLTLNHSGYIQRFVWNERSSEWTLLYATPPNECNNYGKCGVNGVCSISNSSIASCECLKGFVPESPEGQHIENQSWSRRCVRNGPSDCENGEGFQKLEGIKLPDLIDFSLNESMSLKECEVNCLKNCSCRGYASVNISRPDSGCLMWFGDLIDVSKMTGEYKEWDMYIRVPSSELGSAYNSIGKRRRNIIMVIAIVPGVIILTMVLCFLKKQWKKGQKSRKENAEVHLFDLATISIATNNFSQENLIGAGGFGFVYKGILPTGQEIAVKRLSNSSGQGVEEFRNEVILIAKLQHRNLVGLCGSCIQGEERLLIYEYMPNKSLDYFIFDNDRRVLLAWEKRFDIVIQIARGLLYLHQDSKLHIVHRDLKVSNILLDSDLNPKISDFGLARIFEGDDKISETKRVIGTFCYMSPEYAVKGIFSMKSDVFSLGVLLLEIISGKKNRNFSHPDHHYNLLGHAWVLWNEGRALELVDTCLKDSIVESQVLRCIQVGLLCVQNFPEDRPAMSSVNFMLAKEAVLPHPREPGFFTEKCCNADIGSNNEEVPTVNVVTITMPGGR